MPTLITLNAPDRRIEFLMQLDPDVPTESAILWHYYRGVVPEPEVVHLMMRVLRPGDCAIDGGANIGFFTLLMAKLVGDSGHVIAVEPDTDNFVALERNLALNFCKADCRRAALWDYSLLPFFHAREDAGTGSMWAESGPYVCLPNMGAVYLDEVGGERLRLIKFDIEGAEYRALKGGPKLLREAAVPFVICEMNAKALEVAKTSPAAIRELMHDYGYDMFLLWNDGALPSLIPPGSAFRPSRPNTNVLFSTLEHVSKVWPEVSDGA